MREDQFSLRRLLAVVAIAALVLGGLRWFAEAQRQAGIAAVRSSYMNGGISFEAALDRVGPEAETWRLERERPHP
jgi:hypothetical protein